MLVMTVIIVMTVMTVIIVMIVMIAQPFSKTAAKKASPATKPQKYTSEYRHYYKHATTVCTEIKALWTLPDTSGTPTNLGVIAPLLREKAGDPERALHPLERRARLIRPEQTEETTDYHIPTSMQWQCADDCERGLH